MPKKKQKPFVAIPSATPSVKPHNPYGRHHDPEKVGHMLMMEEGEDGKKFSEAQFNTDYNNNFYRPLEQLQNLSLTPVPVSTQLQNLSLTPAPASPQKTTVFSPSKLPKLAYTPNGSRMISKRHVRLSITDSETKEKREGAVLFFSPERTGGKKRKQPPNYSDQSSDSDDDLALTPKAKLNTELFNKLDEQDYASTKGGDRTTVVPNRKGRKKARTQKAVMGYSAKDALLHAISNDKENYETSVLEKLKLLAETVSMEWLHCLAFKLAPKDFEPQDRNNLGAGPDYINSYMMVLENLASYFAKLYPKAVTVMPVFKMLKNSEVIEEIEYEVTIEKDGKIVRFSNKINAIALLDPSNWPSCSDTEQLKRVTEALLNDTGDSSHKHRDKRQRN